MVTKAGQDIAGTNQPYLVLENKMQVQTRYKFDCTTAIVNLLGTDSSKASPEELYVSWNDLTAAYEYDLEWTYMDSSVFANNYHKGSHPTGCVLSTI